MAAVTAKLMELCFAFFGGKNGEFKSRISVFEGNMNVCKIFPFESFLRFLIKAAMQHVLRTQLLIRHPKLTCSNTHLLFFLFFFFFKDHFFFPEWYPNLSCGVGYFRARQ